MNLQVLVSTMQQKDFSLVDRMNIQTSAIIVNQCDTNNVSVTKFNDKLITMYSLAERGIGLSRNTALMRATEDICLLADDDCRYDNGYEKIVLSAFEKMPDADIIFFNINNTNQERPSYEKIKKTHRVRIYKALRYGAPNLALKKSSILRTNIFFSLLFGGGAKYCCGEDTLFIVDALKKGLKLYAVPEYIGTIVHRESTWFKGYDEKYFVDKGVLFTYISPLFAYFLCLQYLIRHREIEIYKNNITFCQAWSWMNKGIKIAKDSKR